MRGMIIVVGVILFIILSICWSTKKREEAATKAFGRHMEEKGEWENETGPRDSA